MKRTSDDIKSILAGLFTIAGMLMLFSSCEKENGEILFTGDEYQNIYQYIEENSDSYSSFLSIIDIGRMKDALTSYNSHLGGNGFTLFLPDNDAVIRFLDENENYGTLDDLLRDTIYTRELARYHVLNVAVLSSDFANGALPDKTLTDDFLTIIFNEAADGNISYSVNNDAVISQVNIETNNGIIHTIEKMLVPVLYTGYDWVQSNKNTGFGIFAELLEMTGLADTMNHFTTDELGQIVYDDYTLFIESDSLYEANGIYTINDLIAMIGPEDSDYSAPKNEVNKYARYHILSQSVFLDEFQTGLYNTYGEFPVSVDFESLDIKVNEGVEVFETIIEGSDTTHIDYIAITLDLSNINTKTGALHELDQMLFPFLPGRKKEVYEFYEEYQINSLKNTEGNTDIRAEDLEVIELFGVDFLTYTKSGSGISGVFNRDYITVTGNFEFTYHIPKILAGIYEVRLTAHRANRSNAIFQFYIDGNKHGTVIDLTSGSSNASGFVPEFVLGTYEFTEYEGHTLKIKTLVPGRIQLDRITFIPVEE